MCGEFGEVTVIIGLVINFLAVGTLLLNSHDTLSYGINSNEEGVGVEMGGNVKSRNRRKNGRQPFAFSTLSVCDLCKIFVLE